MYFFAVFLPLIGALLSSFFSKIGDKEDDKAQIGFICLCMGVSAILSVKILFNIAFGTTHYVNLMSFINVGELNVEWGLYFDTLSAVMLATVAVVSFIIHIYSIGYMAHDKSKVRFMCYLSLFTFLMYMLVTANNLVQMFFGWEGVGLSSYLLIGFWHEKLSARKAAIKAFVVNRIGDLGFLLGMFLLYKIFNNLSLSVILNSSHEHSNDVISILGREFNSLNLACVLLFVGAMGKSAQIGLHVWLPDAMEGPTPVSALIHAATMVTAGVFLIARLSPLYELCKDASEFVLLIGSMTAFFAATIACVQFDIKKVIAYSTCSQLGFMFAALGVGAYSAAIFHLVTHAFFKSLLFLGAGSVIHAMSNEQDMRNMGGIFKDIKFTYVIMWIGSLSLAGMPLFSGYFSKDMILEALAASDATYSFLVFDERSYVSLAFNLCMFAAMMTAFYSWRLLFITFHGEKRGDEAVMARVKESPFSMLFPLFLLALGAVFLGAVASDYFIGDNRHDFWDYTIVTSTGGAIARAIHLNVFVKLLPTLLSLCAIFIAYVFYIKWIDVPLILSDRLKSVYILLKKKWFFDDVYNFVFIKGAFSLGRVFWKMFDEYIIDGLLIGGILGTIKKAAKQISAVQTGYIYNYMFLFVLGFAMLLGALIVFGVNGL
jgi:NADH-quinone oxidoreductase subunit L